MDYVRPDALARRTQIEHFGLVATHGNQIVGVIEMRENNHVALLFVDDAFHRQGIAKELLRRALEMARSQHPSLACVTVQASRYAVPVYERLGFRTIGPGQTVNGIRFIPMALELND